MKMENPEERKVERNVDDEKALSLLRGIQEKKINVDSTKSATKLHIKPDDNSNYWKVENLPSKYRLYELGTEISARPLKVIEVKKLAGINEDNANYIINEILRKCVRGINVDDIYLADKMYLILWIRANTFRDNSYKVEQECSKCGKTTGYHFNIDNLNVNYISDEYNPEEKYTLPSGDIVTLKHLTIGDEISIESFKDRYFKLFTDSGEEIDDDLLREAFMINTINGEERNPLDKYNYITDIPPTDYSYIKTKLEKITMGVSPVLTVKCSECGGESLIGITFRTEFFIPKYSA